MRQLPLQGFINALHLVKFDGGIRLFVAVGMILQTQGAIRLFQAFRSQRFRRQPENPIISIKVYAIRIRRNRLALLIKALLFVSTFPV